MFTPKYVPHHLRKDGGRLWQQTSIYYAEYDHAVRERAGSLAVRVIRVRKPGLQIMSASQAGTYHERG